jgi:hypothetical protein
MTERRNVVIRTGVVVALAFLFLAISVTPARAGFVLRLTQGANPAVTVPDCVIAICAGGDINPVAGIINFSGAVGVFNLNIETAQSKPFLPASSASASMNLSSANFSTGAGTLKIEITDTGFPAANEGIFKGSVANGSTTGSVSFSQFKDPANNGNEEFGTGGTSLLFGPFGPGPVAFSASGSTPHPAIGPYSMTLVALITHTGIGASGFDFDIQNIPEPASLALFGIGLIALALLNSRRRRSRPFQAG